MGNKKKLIIAIILFILLGAAICVFVIQDNNKKAKANDEEITEKKDTKEDEKKNTNDGSSSRNYNSHGVDESKIVDSSYDDALKALENAEEKFDSESYEEAKELIDKVTDEEKKEELTKRLDEVKNGVDTKELVADLKAKVTDAANFQDIEEARIFKSENEVQSKVEDLTSETLKQELQESLDEIDSILNDIEPAQINIDDGAILSSETKVIITDANEFTATLIKNGQEVEFENEDTVGSGVYELTVVDKAFNEISITFIVDTLPPTVTVTYSTTDPTNGDVTVTIETDEVIEEINGWTKVDDTTYTKVYTQNEEETLTIKDIAQNEVSQVVSVNNIDKVAPTATVSVELVTDGYKVILTPSEEINDITGFTKEQDTYYAIYGDATLIPETLTISDLVGNSSEIDVVVHATPSTSLQDLIDNANDGDIIVLDEDLGITSEVVISSKNITIIQNGSSNLSANLTIEDGAELRLIVDELNITNGQIINNGELIIEDGTITTNANGQSRILNSGTLTITGTTINNTNSGAQGVIDNSGELNLSDVNITDNGTTSSATIINRANSTANITGGSIVNTGTGASGNACISNLDGAQVTITDTQLTVNSNKKYAFVSDGATVEINNAGVDSKGGAISVSSGNLVINDGNYSGDKEHGILITNKGTETNVTINGGTFEGKKYGVYATVDSSDASDVSITINDGEFEGSSKAVKVDSSASTHDWDIEINGGTYSSDVSEYVTDGHTITHQGGEWIVE